MISTGAVIVWCLVAAEGILFVLIHAIGFLITSSSPRRTSENEDDAWKLEWRNVSYGIRQFRQPPKLLLKDVSGSAAPGEILAVMGASGSGKTTLLDVLSGNIGRGGRKGLFSGNIFVNGARINSSLLMNKQCCFVFQKETLLSCFTVDEYLKFIAGMLGYDSVTQARRLDEVRKLLRIEHIGSHRIGDEMESQISGGQRRKVALAEGLLSNNRLLFLDEPTTGLSASDAQELMDVLRDVADHGFTIIMTIHQPRQSIFAKINNVLLISAGNQVYFGPTAGVTDYFEAHGFTLPEDEIVSDGALDVLENAKCATELSTMWRTENPPAPLDYTEDNRRVLLTFLVQSLRNFATVGALPREFLCLAKMYILVALRHLPAIVLMAVVDVLNGVLIGLIFLNLGDDMSHFFNYVAAIFCIIRRAPTFPAISALYYQLKPNVELQIFVGRYKTFTFAISWILRVTIHQIISAALLAIVPTVMLGFNVETVFATWAVCTMILMIMSMLISSFSVIMPQFPISMSLSVMVFLLAMIANGFFIREQDVWEGLRWTVPVGFVRQFLDISTHLELADMDFTDEVTKLRTSGSELLKNQGFRGQLLYDFGLGLVWVMATILLYTLLTYGKNIYCRMVISRRLSISNIKKNEELFQTLDTPEHPEQPHIEDDPFLRTEDIDANAMFAWHNVTVQTQTGAELLHGVSGFLKAGEVLAIMGPSGSGKSTLVNCLSGVATSGLVTRETLIVNKQVIAANSIQHYVSFMTQNEVLSPFLTVQEILTMTADLRLRNLSFKDRAVRVNHVMQLTKLGRVQFSRLDKLSGGERKRVSLAQTLLCTKQILVLDEPTSGLSGSDAKLIVNIIREYAKTYNAIVLVTIHQPRSSVFFRFDKLLLLCQGCPCYFGSPANAKNFFALNGIPIDRHIPNEADAILDMILDAAYAGMDNEDVFYRVEALHDLHTSKQQRSMENAFREYLDQPPVTIRNWNIKGILNEIIVLTEWYGKVQLRNRSTGLGFFIRSTILAVLFGLFFLSLSHSAEAVFSRVGSIYLIGVIGYAFFVLPQGYAELHNLPFMLHDTRVGLYRLPIAAVVNWGITHCRIAIASVIMSVVTFWMIGYDGVFRKFMIYLLGIHLLGLWGYLTSLMCCMISWSAPLAVLMGSNLMIVLTSFTGFLVTLDNIPGFLHWLIYINPVYYVNELLVVNEMIAQSFDCDHPDQIHLLVSCPVTGLQVIEYFGYDVHSVLKDVLCCIALLAGYFMLAFAGLMIRENWRPPAFIVRTVSRLRRKNVEESRFRFGEGNRNLVKFV